MILKITKAYKHKLNAKLMTSTKMTRNFVFFSKHLMIYPVDYPVVSKIIKSLSQNYKVIGMEL